MAECPESTSSDTSSASKKLKLQNTTSNILIRIEDLVNCRSVEKQKLEFKKSWNIGATKFQIIKTISAFANDFYNDNGGYIVIGVAEDNSEEAVQQIELPPVGIDAKKIERIQKEIFGACKSLIRPSYSPILAPEVLDDKHVLVIWVQPSEQRPHKAKESANGEYQYFIRKGPETTKANDEEIKSLLLSSAKIPFDDRMVIPEPGEKIDHNDIGYELVMDFLENVHSTLEQSQDRSTLEKLNLVVWHHDEEQDGKLKPVYMPKNVALLMFNLFPHKYFPGAKIEVAQLTRDNEVVFNSTKEFTGPLQDQIKQCMNYVFTATNKEKSASLVTYPHKALRESIVNAVYHRGYEREHYSPTKVNIRPDCLEIISYPGPHPSLKQEEFTKGSTIPPVQARNRRIGEFLRQLNLAEARGTGVETIFRTMEKNDNPLPTFKFNHFYFQVTLPAHPKFQASMLIKDVEELEASGNLAEAKDFLKKAIDKDTRIINQHVMQKLIFLSDNNDPFVKKHEAYIKAATKERCTLLKELEKWLEDKAGARRNLTCGVSLVNRLVKVDADSDDLSPVTAFVYELYTERDVYTRKPILKSNQAAHQLLEAYGQSLLSENGSLLYHLACVKYQLYTILTYKKDKRSISKMGILNYLTKSRDLLQNALSMSSGEEDLKLFAQQQRQLGYVLSHLSRFRKAGKNEFQECFHKAMKADPSIRIPQFF